MRYGAEAVSSTTRSSSTVCKKHARVLRQLRDLQWQPLKLSSEFTLEIGRPIYCIRRGKHVAVWKGSESSFFDAVIQAAAVYFGLENYFANCHA